MSVTHLFQVEDMTCGHCEKAITKALDEALPGAAVTIDLKAHEVAVEGDVAKAEEAIREAGYTPVRKSA